MGSGNLTIDLDALTANRRVLDAMAVCETAAVVKADGYGQGVDRAAKALAKAGARRFFVAVAEEGAALRQAFDPIGHIVLGFEGQFTRFGNLVKPWQGGEDSF